MVKRVFPYSQNLQVYQDDRGIFVPFIQNTTLKNGLTIKRVYYVFNPVKGIVRGFHYHVNEWKYFTVLSGSAKIIALDPKKPKETYTFVASERSQAFIIIPPKFANGWVSLEDRTILLAASTSTLEESIHDDKRIDPYKWGDMWNVRHR